MFNFLRKAKPEVVRESPKTANGVFSTDLTLIAKKPSISDVANALRRSFQKDTADFKVYNADGVASAMDSGTQEGLKLTNNYGEGLPWAQLSWYASQGFIGYQNAAMMSQQWLIDKACSMPALDAVRNGFDLTINDGTEIDPKIVNEIRELDKKYNLNEHCVELIRKKRIFGIRVAKFEVTSKDKKYYEKPFNADGITPGSYKGISQIDPYWITPELDADAVTPGTQYFYEPTWWRINGQRIHRTHLVVVRNGNVPDILKPTYLYGGISVPQKIAERVYAAERTANEGPMLALTKRLTVLKADITQAAVDMCAFEEKLRTWTELMNNYGVKVISGDEEITQFDTGLADVDNVIMTQYQLVSAGADVPATKLLGTSPKGFNASGTYEAKSYHELLRTLQASDLSPLVDRHHEYVMRSDFPELFKANPIKIHAVWKPVDSPDAAEMADINSKKADTDVKLSQAGAIDGTDIRMRLISDPESGYNGIEEVVEGGPGDREHEQEVQEELLANSNAPSEPKKEEREQLGA